MASRNESNSEPKPRPRGKKRAYIPANPTAPNADDARAPAPAQDTPGVPAPLPPVEPGPPPRAYTWRLTSREAEALDELHTRVVSRLGKRTPRSQILAALVAEANKGGTVYRAMLTHFDHDRRQDA